MFLFFYLFMCLFVSLLTKHFTQLCVVQIWVLLRKPLAFIFCPHHKCVHRPADARLTLSAPGTRWRTCLVFCFRVRKRTERVHPRALPHARHQDWAGASGLARVVTGVTRIGTAHLLHTPGAYPWWSLMK